MTPSFEKVEVGHAYLVEIKDAKRVLEIHRIMSRSETTYLLVSSYVFLRGNPDTLEASPLLNYRDWNHVGEELEWEKIRITDITRVLQSCQITLATPTAPQIRTTNHADNGPHIFVSWGISTSELRKLRNRADKIEIDLRDQNLLSSTLTVHDYNCGIGGFTTGFKEGGCNVVIGVEPCQSASESWKV